MRLNIPEPEFRQIIYEYAWIYQHICEFAKSVWMNFILIAPIGTPCLHKSVVTYFNKVYSLKEHKVTILISGKYFRD